MGAVAKCGGWTIGGEKRESLQVTSEVFICERPRNKFIRILNPKTDSKDAVDDTLVLAADVLRIEDSKKLFTEFGVAREDGKRRQRVLCVEHLRRKYEVSDKDQASALTEWDLFW